MIFLSYLFVLLISNLFRCFFGLCSPNVNIQSNLVLVDGFTEYLSGHGREYCEKNNIRIIELISPYLCALLESNGRIISNEERAPIADDDIIAWGIKNNIYSVNEKGINENICIIAESDSGVSTAEKIQSILKARGNGMSPHLRNKFIANENGKKYGLKTVKQSLIKNPTEALEFVDNLWSEHRKSNSDDKKCVVKPYRGVASDGVYLCSSLEEVNLAVLSLLGKPKYGGGVNEAILIQEYVGGTEYAVDTVAMDGDIRVVALWKYAKLPANGAPFVYQCTELLSSATGQNEVDVCNYCVDILRAQGLKWGPTHTEIKINDDGPRLIEINARWHAQHFYPVVTGCLGYDAVTSTLDAYFNPESFRQLPHRPDIVNGAGLILHLISYFQGIVTKINHLEFIQSLPSVIFIEIVPTVGDVVELTVDIRTDCGYVLLRHDDPAVVASDFNTIVELQSTLFEVQSE